MPYHAGMRRPGATVLIAAMLPLGGVVTAGFAAAEPPPPCAFTLSAPQVVHHDGVDAVAATVAPADCGPPAAPHMSVACVQPADAGAPMQCAQGRGAQPAQVYFTPLVPGVTYTATGRGCGSWIGTDPAPLCQQLGPLTAAF